MRGWKRQPLAAVGVVTTGSTPATSQKHYYGGELPFVTPADLGRIEPITDAARSLSEAGEREARVVPTGAVLVCCIGSLGKVGIAGRKLALNQQINAVVFNEDRVWPRFGLYACRLLKSTLEMMAPATTVAIVSKSKFELLEIPVPPLPEQRRIAEVLDRAEALRAKRRIALAHFEEMTQAIFLTMFGDAEAAKWPTLNIAEVAHPADGSIRTGPFGSQLLHDEFVDDGIAVLGIDNAVANEFRWAEPRYITESKYRQLRRYTVRPGDVLITIMGTCGRCAIVPKDVPTAINTKHLCCITLDPEKCLPSFLHAYFLRHPLAKRYLQQTQKGAIMSGLNMGIIKAMPIPLPPLPLQREFARRAEAVERMKAAQRASLAEMDALFASLQHRAFRGEL